MTQPVTPELREWVVAQLAAGHSVAALRTSMRMAGWQDTATDAALAEIERGAPEIAPVTVTAASAALPGPDLEGSPLYLEAGDRRVHVLHTLAHPRVVVFGDLLADEECEALIASARKRLARSLTVETQTGGEVLNVDRTSDGMFFERGETEVVARVEQRIAALLNWPLVFGEGLQVLRYGPGAQYRPHYDYFDPGEPGTPTILRRGGQRVGTLVMYLQEPVKGGATTFPDVGLEVAPKRGTGVFFSYDRPHPDTRTLHGGAPVLEGEKWVATKWLREREFI
ncbi:2OG-Fe(II) oxygenase [Variovorax sp. UMC13]|uniref:2OG-Fe(II) oxygenase n=1 Tax=Variovorax sp. UMC13 TaxID=1862326 RepID=UPI0016033393|nr:2OG-Fe(II) oxygenase [Variovorax sp. UMC13]MBB1600132.1 proline dioxygenase [Variovorax sp. UMC13]